MNGDDECRHCATPPTLATTGAKHNELLTPKQNFNETNSVPDPAFLVDNHQRLRGSAHLRQREGIDVHTDRVGDLHHRFDAAWP